MLFEPEALLLLASRAGIRLYRNGDLLEARRAGGIPKVWADALRRHKPDLLPILPGLPECEARRPAPQGEAAMRPAAGWIPAAGENFELFGQPPARLPRPRPRPAKRLAATPAADGQGNKWPAGA